ncbi:MAG: family acetyltransferase [Eubacterium sp.]|jgi:ribosomal-protein-alanine N-acetyltransferase|nr:family acetyltransferase [Eubacterium sp.]
MLTNLNHKGTVPLETDRLLLRALTQKDAEKVYKNWTSNTEVTRFLRWDAHTSVEVTKDWIKCCEESSKNAAFYDWGIILKETCEPVGSISAFIGEDPNRYEVGYVLAKKYWNKGIVSEALKRVLEFLHIEVGIKNFYALHAVGNPASGAVMLHAGFKYVGEGIYKSFNGLKEFQSKVYFLDLE